MMPQGYVRSILVMGGGGGFLRQYTKAAPAAGSR